MWTEAQVRLYVVQQGATYVTTKHGVEWWRLPGGMWLAAKKSSGGRMEVKQLPSGSCGCGD